MKKIWLVGICYWCRKEIKSNKKYNIFREKLFHNPKCYIDFLENEMRDKEKEIEFLNEWFVKKKGKYESRTS